MKYLFFFLISFSVSAQVQFNSAQINSAKIVGIFENEYQSYLDRLTALGYTKPSAGQQKKQNTLCSCLKLNVGSPLSSVFDNAYIIANDGGSDAASVNIIYPSSFQISWVNSPTFTTNQGITGDGATSYADLNYAPSTNGVVYAQNSAHRSIWVYADPGPGAVWLDGNSNTSHVNGIFSGNNISQKINQNIANASTTLNPNGTGLVGIDRSDATNIRLYAFNSLGTTASATATSSATNLNLNQYISRNGSAYGNNTISWYSMGAHLTDSQWNNLNTCLKNYINSL